MENKDAAIRSVNPYSFSVRSSSRPGVTYSVIVHPTRDAHCLSMTMCKQHHICWHIISCLLAVGMTDHDLLKGLGGFWGSKFGGHPVLWKSQTLLTASHPIPMPATSADERPQVHQTPHFSQTCPTKERRLITESVAELTEFVSCAPLESLMEMRFGLRHLIATCKKTQSQRAHLVEAAAANVVIHNNDDDNSLKRKKNWLEIQADRKRQKLPKPYGPPIIPVKPPKQKIGKTSVADELRAATLETAQSTQRPAQLQSKPAYKDPVDPCRTYPSTQVLPSECRYAHQLHDPNADLPAVFGTDSIERLVLPAFLAAYYKSTSR